MGDTPDVGLPPIPPAPPSPPSPPEPPSTGLSKRSKVFLVAIAGLIVIGVVGNLAANKSTSGASPTLAAASPSAPAAASPTNTYSPPPPSILPDPKATYSKGECDYILGAANFSAGGFPNAKVIASTDIHNTGNVGVVVSVKAYWEVTGGASIVQTKKVEVGYNKSKRLAFSALIGNRLDALQQAAFHNGWCGVKVSIVNTFGTPSG